MKDVVDGQQKRRATVGHPIEIISSFFSGFYSELNRFDCVNHTFIVSAETVSQNSHYRSCYPSTPQMNYIQTDRRSGINLTGCTLPSIGDVCVFESSAQHSHQGF